MQLTLLWLTLAVVAPVALLQGWMSQKLYRRRLADVKARHFQALQATDKLLRQSRQQNAQLHQELAAARITAAKRPASPAPAAATVRTASPLAHHALMKLLDEDPASKRELPLDGFADTLPSEQFPHASAFGQL
jgi:hypothetical protein